MQELQELSALAEALKSSLPRLASGPDDEAPDPNHQEMLLSVRHAVDRTRGYIARLGQERTPASGHGSLALKNAWSAAGVELLRYDPRLARKCVLKSFYWSSADAWSREQAESAYRAFEEVRATVEELLADTGGGATGWNRATGLAATD